MLEPLSAKRVRLSSPRVPAMKKSLLSLSHRQRQSEQSPKYSVTLMQHKEDPNRLGQNINQIILSSHRSEIVLKQIAQLLGQAFQVDCCLVMIGAENQELASEIGWWDADPSVTAPPQAMKPWEQLKAVMPTDANLLALDDVNAVESSALTWLSLKQPVRAILQIPTWFQGKLNGVISLIRFQPYHWSEPETKLASAIASSVAIAFSHVVQTQMLASLQQQVRTSVHTKNVLNQLSMASRSSLELNQILQLAITNTAQALEATRGFILLLKYVDPLFKSRAREKIPKAKATVVCEWSQELDAGLSDSHSQTSTLLNQSFWTSESLLCQQAIINSPSPVIITDNCDLQQIDTATEATLFNLSHLPSLLMLPLESQGTVLGFLVLQHSSARNWHPEELSLVDLVSAQISTTIIQNQTLRQVQSLVDERTAQLQRSLEVQGKLYEKTRQQIDQLRQLNQLKDEFLSTMSHELRTPLTNMSLAIRMLRQPGITTARQVTYLDILEQQCTQEINLINDLLKLQQLESNQATLKLETIDVKFKIRELAQLFEQEWADKGLAIQLDIPKAPLQLQTDIESFERILQELLTNAGKYSNPDTTVVLKVSHQVEQQVERIVLSLTNTGSGIAPEDMTYIFDKFRRGQGVTQRAIQGTGLGLALVKCLVQHLNGSIDATSSAINNSSAYETCFTLTLPQSFASR